MIYNKLTTVGMFLFSTVLYSNCQDKLITDQNKPNVIIILTDDQGYGDLGITGNPHIKTPVLDNFASESIRFNQFYVSPACAPTRASLMTGRYSIRTRVRDTSNGGAIMSTEEVTIAEILKQVGYRTGIFGKWHLGDSYPFRPMDQGFDESVIHLAGGIGQYGDFPNFFREDSSYFDPILWHNGEQKPYQGYCSDIFAEEAIGFIEQNHQKPFFCYLSFNAPHTPLQVPDEYYNMYKNIDPAAGFEDDDRPFPKMSENDKEAARKVYAMVSNIDDNVGKLLQKLDELNISDNTLLIFMTDNGPQQYRYIAGMSKKKGSVFRGGVRVPFYWRLPALFQGNKDIETNIAHIDILPTIAQLCHAELPTNRIIDGKSFLPLLKGEKADDFEKRPLFFYWTRRYPELYRNIALQKGHYKLVGNTDFDASIEDFELYDIKNDEYEQKNILSANKTLASEMKSELDQLIYELTSSYHQLNPPRIIIGSELENPVILNRNDAGGERGIRYQEEAFGKWDVKIHEGYYNIKIKFMHFLETPGTMFLETNSIVFRLENKNIPTDIIEMKDVYLPEMECDLIPHYATGGKYPSYGSEGKYILPLYVEMEKLKSK